MNAPNLEDQELSGLIGYQQVLDALNLSPREIDILFVLFHFGKMHQYYHEFCLWMKKKNDSTFNGCCTIDLTELHEYVQILKNYNLDHFILKNQTFAEFESKVLKTMH